MLDLVVALRVQQSKCLPRCRLQSFDLAGFGKVPFCEFPRNEERWEVTKYSVPTLYKVQMIYAFIH